MIEHTFDLNMIQVDVNCFPSLNMTIHSSLNFCGSNNMSTKAASKCPLTTFVLRDIADYLRTEQIPTNSLHLGGNINHLFETYVTYSLIQNALIISLSLYLFRKSITFLISEYESLPQ